MKHFIKEISLFILISFWLIYAVFLAWSEHIEENKKKQYQIEQAARQRQQYLQSLACVPKQTIDKTTLFANVMKQCWQYKIKRLWQQDKSLEEFYGYETNLVQSSCGLQEPYKMTQETCYPWQVPYQNLEELYLGLSQERTGYQYNNKHNRFSNRMLSLNAKAYHPEKDENIYLNTHNHFSIIKRNSDATLFYPSNCCQIYSYEEMKKNHLLNKVHFSLDISLISNEIIEKLNFLKVKYYDIDDCNLDRGNDGCIGSKFSRSPNELKKEDFFEDIQVFQEYYPISQCGTLNIFQLSQ